MAVKLTSPPVDGKANKDLIKFIAKKLGVAPSAVSIVKGETSREKILLVQGLDATQASRILGAAQQDQS